MISFLVVPILFIMMGMKNTSSKENFQSTAYLPKSIKDGAKVYKKYCISCHQPDGGGVPNLSPPLIQTSFVLGEKEKLIKIVLNGLKNVDVNEETYNNPMPELGSVLKDQEIADVLTYVRNSFGNKASAVSVGEVKAARNSSK